MRIEDSLPVGQLPKIYKQQLQDIKKEYKLSDTGALVFLIDNYNLADSFIISSIVIKLPRRIKKGIDHSFINQLKILYTYLGHFLKGGGFL